MELEALLSLSFLSAFPALEGVASTGERAPLALHRGLLPSEESAWLGFSTVVPDFPGAVPLLALALSER